MLVNRVNLNVKVVGSGPPVVALHGFAGDMTTWREFVQDAQERYTVITIDLLGHGGSDAPATVERYRMELAVDDIAATVRELGFSQVCLLGYSMGGRIALAAAALLPSTCRCLVIEGASPGLTSRSARARRQRKDETLANLILTEGIEAFTNHWAEQPLFNSQKSLPTHIQDRIRSQRLKSNPIGLANTLLAIGPGAQPPINELLPAVNIPVLCITGEYDRKFTTIARRMCEKLQRGQLEVIPGTGHAPHIEKPSAFNKVVLAFLHEALD